MFKIKFAIEKGNSIMAQICLVKTLAYYRNYLNDCTQLQQNGLTLLKFYSILACLVCGTLHQFYMATAEMTNYRVIVLYNPPFITHQSPLFNIIWCASGPTSFAFYRILYFNSNAHIHKLLLDVLFRGQSDLLPAKQKTFDHIQRVALRVANRVQFFIVVAGNNFSSHSQITYNLLKLL